MEEEQKQVHLFEEQEKQKRFLEEQVKQKRFLEEERWIVWLKFIWKNEKLYYLIWLNKSPF